MSSSRAAVFSEVRAQLGEGPVWDSDEQRLVWVDIDGQLVHVTSADGGSTRSYATPAPVGAAALHRGGDLLLAVGIGFARLSLDDGAIRPLVDAPGVDAAIARMNDGEVDPAGRYWAGTKAYDNTPGGGTLFRLDAGGHVETVLAGVTISNGLAWSRDGGTLYYVDTPTRSIQRFAFEMAGGTLGARAVHADTSALSGSPDGMTIDADGNLWVAFWGGWCVRCFSGADGSLLEEIALPVEQCSSVQFGGPELRTLFVTSASVGLDAQQLAGQPDAGRVHVVTPGAEGVATRAATV
ncbi:SMP-30/gluconolactonase/LRE family protein [Conexibacter sp. JD483]|uniref:SMP-30/gluconolactonase/LRE family protein n=1 Tax=unclassified Conexibacter TaxID=2627773 RepID=UPI00271D65CF|nr:MULTISPECIES: SMP-30/gluconolactonase/LRE family protein [unclassified Conexibacter]MDO8189257.1 SMP-30/gluconolactonase/LRE family protein [Conexibacter sp. CPCC 205706]MDO8201264.1 SMP-30/gluconolactonase/LRE family protein [Conexibacter sp. CPCC 205762]MDR9372181.1 SMP-30/gluconolactonase/LRE family protein [Conexibacter sp. JD483]